MRAPLLALLAATIGSALPQESIKEWDKEVHEEPSAIRAGQYSYHCYKEGQIWPPVSELYMNIDSVCEDLSGRYYGNETKYACRGGDFIRHVDFWIANSGRQRNLSMSECVDGFRGIWDYCHYGGRTYHEAWYFR